MSPGLHLQNLQRLNKNGVDVSFALILVAVEVLRIIKYYKAKSHSRIFTSLLRTSSPLKQSIPQICTTESHDQYLSGIDCNLE